jgi:hypothetical protein
MSLLELLRLNPNLNVILNLQSFGYLMLDTRYLMLDTGFQIPDSWLQVIDWKGKEQKKTL